MKRIHIVLSDEAYDKLNRVAERLYPLRGDRRRSEVVERMALVVELVGKYLVADERKAA